MKFVKRKVKRNEREAEESGERWLMRLMIELLDYFLLSLYLVNEVGELKLRTLVMAVVICRLGPVMLRDIPLLQKRLKIMSSVNQFIK